MGSAARNNNGAAMTNKALAKVSVCIVEFTWQEGVMREERELGGKIVEGGINQAGRYFLIPENPKDRKEKT